MQISLNEVQYYIQQFDADRNGGLNRQETAMAAYSLYNQNNPAASFFSTLVQGGKEGTGLLPDINNNQQFDMSDAWSLSRLSGSNEAIEPSDFQAGFGPLALSSGRPIDLAQLAEIANGDSIPSETKDVKGLFDQLLPMLLTAILSGLGLGGESSGSTPSFDDILSLLFGGLSSLEDS